jgi:transcriptional regulator of arginine metabolism
MRKKNRQAEILRVIKSKNIQTQLELINELTALGITTTQATLSRDVRDLQLIKEQGIDGTYRYIPSAKSDVQNYSARVMTIFRESVISYTNAENIVVIKTLPGLAPAACSALDSMGIEHLMGSIAGDDTGFLAMSNTETAREFCIKIANMLE